MQQTPLYRDLLLRRQTVCCTNISTRDKGPHARYRMASGEPGGDETGRKARRKPWISRLLPETPKVCLFSVNLIHDLLNRDSLKTGWFTSACNAIRYAGRRMQEGMDCWCIIYRFPSLIYNTVINYYGQMTARVLNRRDRRYVPHLTVWFGPLSWISEYDL